MTVIATIREIQAPVLALVLLGACSAKLIRVLRSGSVRAGLGPTELFPRPLRRPVAVILCCSELGLGVALVVTAGRFGAGSQADAVRLATALLFAVALCGLVELREHRPDLGCGCFGDLSVRPVGIRTIARAGLLAAAALVSVGSPPLRLAPPGPRAIADLGILVAALLLVARLGATVMFVILLLAAITVLSDKLSFEPGMSVALFPLVILTMTIERVSVIWDESGPAEAIKLAVLSLIIAAFCYLLMAARPVQHVFFAFPETVLVLVAMTLLIGRYTGYRLSELIRFKVLAERKQ